MSFSKGLEMDAISERLNAPIILIIYLKLASLLFLLYSFTYSYTHVEITLKSFIFSLTRSPKSITDRLRFVVVELGLHFGSYKFFDKLITLVIYFVILAFFGSAITLCGILPSLEAENVARVKCIETAQELIA